MLFILLTIICLVVYIFIICNICKFKIEVLDDFVRIYKSKNPYKVNLEDCHIYLGQEKVKISNIMTVKGLFVDNLDILIDAILKKKV